MMRNLGIRDPAKKDKASVVYISRLRPSRILYYDPVHESG
jgi:hypothetical protein